MKKDPCVRLGIRMSPKISEKPADRRNRRPPSVTLLIASTSHRFIARGGARRAPIDRRAGARRPAPGGTSALHRWIVSRVHRLRQEPLLVVGPELADLGIGLDRRVDELVAL